MYFISRLINRKWLFSNLIKVYPNMALHMHPIASVSIEASSSCNIHCLCCPIGNNVIKGHNMALDDFTKILDLLPSHIKWLDFSHRGDPTMNPNFSKMVNIAYKRGYRTDIYTNGLILDKYVPEIVESGLNIIRIDLDGASEQSYRSYRIGSNFEKVKSNIQLLVDARSKSKGKFPNKIIILCVVSVFNENEITEIQNMAESLGVDELLFKTAIINYGTKFYHDKASQKKIAPVNEAYRRGVRSKDFICPFLRRGAILYNGDFQICTCDFEGEYILGNILKENSFEKVYYSQRANSIRKKVVKLSGSICKTCAVTGESHYIPNISKKFV